MAKKKRKRLFEKIKEKAGPDKLPVTVFGEQMWAVRLSPQDYLSFNRIQETLAADDDGNIVSDDDKLVYSAELFSRGLRDDDGERVFESAAEIEFLKQRLFVEFELTHTVLTKLQELNPALQQAVADEKKSN